MHPKLECLNNNWGENQNNTDREPRRLQAPDGLGKSPVEASYDDTKKDLRRHRRQCRLPAAFETRQEEHRSAVNRTQNAGLPVPEVQSENDLSWRKRIEAEFRLRRGSYSGFLQRIDPNAIAKIAERLAGEPALSIKRKRWSQRLDQYLTFDILRKYLPETCSK